MKAIIIGKNGKKSEIEISMLSEKKLNFKPSQYFNKFAYFNIRNTAWQFLIDNNIKTLPLNLNNLIKNNGWHLKEYNNLKNIPELKNQIETLEAFTLFIGDMILICYNKNINYYNLRFNIAHEIGHIVLYHMNVKERDFEK